MDLLRFKRELAKHYDDLDYPRAFKDDKYEIVDDYFPVGFTTKYIGHLLNYATSLLGPDEAHVQMGGYCARTLAYALTNNQHKWHYLLVNFEGDVQRRKNFYDWMDKYKFLPYLKVIEGDYQEMLRLAPSPLKRPVGVFFYSASRDYDTTLMALKLMQEHLSNKAMVIVDGTNLEGPAEAVEDWRFSCPNVYEIVNLPSFYTGHPTWFDGLRILGYEKGLRLSFGFGSRLTPLRMLLK